MKTKRQAIQEKRRRRRLFNRLALGLLSAAILAVAGYALWVSVRPAAGQAIPVMEDTGHVPEDAPPGPYNSDPPTSGPHFQGDFEAGFYDEADLASLPPHPEGYLVHNLEHGYVIFWYNCALLDEQGCSGLKEQIRATMETFDNLKLIAFPWNSLEEPVVMTSWGRMLSLESFDPGQARAFIERNRNRAPEPNAP